MLTNSRVFDPEKAHEQIEELYNRAKDGLLFVEEPPNPRTFSLFGIRSWFGRLFGNKEPYDAYDRYTAALADFRQKDADYNAHHEEWEAQVIARNQKRAEVYEMILEDAYREDYPEGTMNIGKLRGGIELFERNIHSLMDTERMENIYNVEVETYRMGRNLERAFEGHENPAFFNPNGSRNKEVSDRYWKNREPLAAEHAEYIKREKATLLKGKVQDTVRADREKERAEHHTEIEQHREAKRYIDQYRQQAANDSKYHEDHFWVACQPTELFEKIGAFYGKDANFGMRVFFGAATQNRAVDLKGEFNPNAVSDKKCSEDIAVLLKYAYFPNTVKKGSPLLARLAPFGDKNYASREVADSLTSLAATGSGYNPEDLDAIDMPTGVCSAVLNRLIKVAKVDLSKPLLTANGEDVRIAGDNDREAAMMLAGTCADVQKGFAFTQNPASVKKQPEAKELSAKRPMNLGL